MKIEFTENDITILSTLEVAQQLACGGAFEIAADEKMGEVEFEDGELVIEILHNDPQDCRIDGYLKRREEFTISDIRKHFVADDYYRWGKDEDGDDILVCFGC